MTEATNDLALEERQILYSNQFFLDVPRFSTEFGKRLFSYLAPTVWNDYLVISDFHPLSTLSNTI